MKPLLAVLAGFAFLSACTRSHEKPLDDPGPPFIVVQIDSVIERIHLYKGTFTFNWGFYYDSRGRLSSVEGPERDTASDGYLNPSFNVIQTFSYEGSDTVPSAVSIQDKGLNVPDETPQYVQLRYQNGLLTSDTITEGTDTHFADYFFYPDKAYRVVSNSGPEDSLYFTGQNLVKDSVMGIVNNGHGDVRAGAAWQTWTYGSDQNPLYIPTFAGARVALYFDTRHDFGLPNVVAETSFTEYEHGVLTWRYSWTKDSKGRINEGIAVDATTGEIEDHIIIKYK